MRVVVHYDPSFGKPGTWIVNDAGTGIRARFKLGGGDERIVDTELRWLRQAGGGRVYASPIDAHMTTWLTETSTFGGQLDVPVVLQLNDTPEWIAEALRQW